MIHLTQAEFEERFNLETGDRIVIGVSGGPDSLCLLDILSGHEFQLVVAYFDHQLREESQNEPEFVKRLANHYGAKYVTDSHNVSAYADHNRLSIEEASRELRYRFLFEQADRFEAKSVVVGHNANDHIETILMHFLRGSGPDGMVGLHESLLPNPWSVRIPLIRPLRDVWRKDIIKHCKGLEFKPVFDRSNLDDTYYRNRIRNSLIPDLVEFNPRLLEQIIKMAGIFNEDKKWIDAYVSNLVEDVVDHAGDGYIVINHQEFLKYPEGLKRRVAREIFDLVLGSKKDLDFNILDHLIKFLESPSSTKKRDLSLGLEIFLEDGQAIILRKDAVIPDGKLPQMEHNAPILINIPGEVAINPIWRVVTRIVDEHPGDIKGIKSDSHYEEFFGLTEPVQSIQICIRKPGDRIRITGMDGHSTKVSDLMVNEKIPRRFRDKYPLFYIDEEIIWIPGLRRADKYDITGSSQQIIKISVQKIINGIL